ncbi:MAG TPA: hypothetical protein DF409_05895 [Bacteroidales bacterium]|nr:hypothetical protein [Bacteroidales bacterium]
MMVDAASAGGREEEMSSLCRTIRRGVARNGGAIGYSKLKKRIRKNPSLEKTSKIMKSKKTGLFRIANREQ